LAVLPVVTLPGPSNQTAIGVAISPSALRIDAGTPD
jgi:hypothetical protein